MARVTCSSRLLALLLSVGSIDATAAADLHSQQYFEQIEEVTRDIYRETIRKYDEALVEQPGDVILAIRRCETIASFASGEYLYLSDAEEDPGNCYREVIQRFPGHPEAILADLQHNENGDFLTRAENLLNSDSEYWNRSQSARLDWMLSQHFMYIDIDPARASSYCLRALEKDAGANCRLLAATHHHENGNTELAIDVLLSPLDPHVDSYYLLQKMAMLSNFEAHDQIELVYRLIDKDELFDESRLEVAAYLGDAGLFDEAYSILDLVSDDFWAAERLARARFKLALSAGDSVAALGHYNNMRDLGMSVDPLLRARFTLAAQDPTLPWKLRDLLGVLAQLALIAFVATLSLSVPVLVHYRGLYRRSRGIIAETADNFWTLRHAWYAIFATLIASVISLYIFSYDLLFGLDGVLTEQDIVALDLSTLMIAETAIATILISPLLFLHRGWQYFGNGRWSIARCLGVGVLAALALRLLFAFPALAIPEVEGIGRVLSNQIAISDMYKAYGVGVVLIVVALVAPLAEEFIFRGVLLQGFSRHISPTSANIVQSTMFAAAHQSLLLAPFYFIFAYVAGNMTRKSHGLLSSVVMHALFNALAVAGLVWAINRSPG